MRLYLLVFVTLFATQVGAQTVNHQVIDSILDRWHSAAAQADLETYFDLMHEDFVFLGTDPSERWNKNAFKVFCKPYFEAGKTWNFKKVQRTIVVSERADIAWFDEEIDTWMQNCRGSGVLIQVDNSWLLVQYNLTVLIENEKIGDFIKLRKTTNEGN